MPSIPRITPSCAEQGIASEGQLPNLQGEIAAAHGVVVFGDGSVLRIGSPFSPADSSLRTSTGAGTTNAVSADGGATASAQAANGTIILGGVPGYGAQGRSVQTVHKHGTTGGPTTTNTVSPGDVVPELTDTFTAVDETNNLVRIRYWISGSHSLPNGRMFGIVTLDGVAVAGSQAGGQAPALNGLFVLTGEVELPAATLAGATVIAIRFFVASGTGTAVGDDRGMTIEEITP